MSAKSWATVAAGPKISSDRTVDFQTRAQIKAMKEKRRKNEERKALEAAEQLKKLSVFQESCTRVNNKPIIIHFSSSSSKKLVGPYKLENVENKTWSIQIQRLSTKVKYIIYADDNYCWWLVRLSGIVHSEFSLGQKITENMILNSYYM
jgi:predicted transcriptional regulator